MGFSDMTDRFSICLPFTMQQECNVHTGTAADWSNPRNFDDDPHDPGGETQCGITGNEYDVWLRQQGLPAVDVRKITQVQGEAIYDGSYWQPNCPKCPAGVDMCVFDENVNAGPRTSTILLQRALGITADGAWGSNTDKAVAAIANPAAIVNAFTAEREAYYRSLSTFKYFGTDWIRRSQKIGAESLKMATGATS
jgi:lysozyme family protein